MLYWLYWVWLCFLYYIESEFGGYPSVSNNRFSLHEVLTLTMYLSPTGYSQPPPQGYGQPPPQGYAPQQGYPAATYPVQQQQTNQTVVVTQAPTTTTTQYVV